MSKLIGTGPNQVPSNADLGSMAYQDADNPRLGTIHADKIAIDEVGNDALISPYRFTVADESHGVAIDYVSEYPTKPGGLYSTSGGGSYPFNQWGNMILTTRTDYGGYYDIAMVTASSNNTPQIRLVVKASGRVGIGTTTPQSKLEVATSENINNYSDGDVQIISSNPIAFTSPSNLNPSLNRWGFKLRENSEGDFSIHDYRQGTSRLTFNDSGFVSLPSNGVLQTRTVDSLYYGTKSLRTTYFTNGVAHQAVDLRLGNTYINSYIRVSINDGFSNQNISGILQNEYVVGFNPNGSMWQPPIRRTSRAFGPISEVFAISDPFWDSTNSEYRIRIHHTGTLGNNITVTIEAWGPSAGTWVRSVQTSSLLTGITPPVIQHENMPGPLGIGNPNDGADQPQKALEVVVPNNDFASVGVRQMSPSNWSGIHFGYRESNNFYRKSAIVFERTDLTENNAQGKVHLLNGPQSGSGNATLSDAKLTIAEQGRIGIGDKFPLYGLHLNQSDTGRSGAMYVNAQLNGSGKGLVINCATRTVNENSTSLIETVSRDGNTGFIVRVDGNASFANNLTVGGTFSATSKSFDIEHPTKEGMRLHHGSLEGPEHGVYVRGRLTDSNVIVLPDYWTGLVDEDTITVQLTAIGGKQDLWVEDIVDNTIVVGSEETVNCFYFVQAERKDVDKFDVEYVDAN